MSADGKSAKMLTARKRNRKDFWRIIIKQGLT
jgi:hypothetical protein